MNPFKRFFDRRGRRNSRSSLRLESLEQRLPLAGNVVAELVGSTLRLTGDSMGNEVVVASIAGGTIAVIGQGTTINGTSDAFVTTKAVTSMIVSLNGGDDAIGFTNSAQSYADARLSFMDSSADDSGADDSYVTIAPDDSGADDSYVTIALDDSDTDDSDADPQPAPFDVVALQSAIDNVAAGATTFSIPGSLTVTTADGDDFVGISGNVGGSASVNLGSADEMNGLLIGAESFASRIGGAVKVVGGSQSDRVGLANMTAAGRVSADLGDGDNMMAIAGMATTPTSIGSFAYRGGTSFDLVWMIGNVTVQNDVRINTGSRGSDSVVVGLDIAEGDSAANVLGNVAITTGSDGDYVSLDGNVQGTVSVKTGGGQDTVCVSSDVAWYSSDDSEPVPSVEVVGQSALGLDLRINTGDGNDLISIAASTVGRNATVDAGAGNDDVRVDTMQVASNMFLRLGAGDDAVTIANLTAFVAYFDGGSGTNMLSMDTAAAAGNRRLRSYRLQAVSNG